MVNSIDPTYRVFPSKSSAAKRNQAVQDLKPLADEKDANRPGTPKPVGRKPDRRKYNRRRQTDSEKRRVYDMRTGRDRRKNHDSGSSFDIEV